MNVTTEPPENCEVLMTVEMDEQEADNLLKAAASDGNDEEATDEK